MNGNTDIVTGARTLLYLDGRPIAHAEMGRVSREFVWDAVETLGLLEVFEHVPTAFLVAVSFDFVRIVDTKKSLTGLGILPTVDTGGVDFVKRVVSAPPLTCAFFDSPTDLPIAEVIGFRGARSDFSFDRRSRTYSSESVVGVARLIRDEAEWAA